MSFPKCDQSVPWIKLLVLKGANVDKPDLVNNLPIIFPAIECNIKVIKLYLDLGVDVNTLHKNGENLLLLCVELFSEEQALTYANFLLSKGIDITYRSPDGRTALDWVGAKKYTSVKYLISNAMSAIEKWFAIIYEETTKYR